MKKYLLLLVAFVPYLLQAQSATPYLTKALNNQHIKNVEVETSGGSVAVTGSGAAEAKIEVYINGNNGSRELSKDEIEKRLSNYELNVAVNGDKLTATAKRKNESLSWNSNGLSISFKIYVPGDVATNLSTSGGSIAIAKLNGTQDFRTSGGSLHVENVTGKIHGRTSGGSIHVSDSKSDINLSTSGGSIEAKNCQGNITLKTSGGSLDLDNLDGTIEASTSGGSVEGSKINGELNASTSGGSIHLDQLACSLEAATSGGSIEIAFNSLGKYVTVSNSSGNIELTLPSGKGLDLRLKGRKIKTSTLSNFSGSVEENSISGQLNGGGIPVRVDAGNGRVELALK